jgi:hypothetical protein
MELGFVLVVLPGLCCKDLAEVAEEHQETDLLQQEQQAGAVLEVVLYYQVYYCQ